MYFPCKDIKYLILTNYVTSLSGRLLYYLVILYYINQRYSSCNHSSYSIVPFVLFMHIPIENLKCEQC